jgi:hypothetical protein
MTIKEFGAKLKLVFIPCKSNNFRPKFLDSNFLIYYLAILLVVKFVILPVSLCFYQSSYFATLTKEFLVTLTNQERKELGIGELRENSTLDQAAASKAQDMLDLDYFSHNSPEGKTPWYWIKLSGYNYQKAGENLAIGFVDGEEVMQAWNDSPSHRANLVNSGYQEIGIGIAKGDFQGQEVTVVVQMFGTKLNSTPVKAAKASVNAGTSQPAVKTAVQQPSQPGQTATGTSQTSSTVAQNANSEVKSQIAVKPAVQQPLESGQAAETTQTSSTVAQNTKGEAETNPIQKEQQTHIPAQTSTIVAAGTEPEVEGAEIQSQSEVLKEKTNLGELSIKFLTTALPVFIEKLNFLSLLVAMIGLLLTIFIEIRVQPKDLLLKGSFFILVFGILLIFDKAVILKFIPHNLLIG